MTTVRNKRRLTATGQGMTGYAHRSYAESLSEWGEARVLPRSSGPILVKGVPESSYRDAAGCYPLFCCLDWRGLAEDLRELEGELVSLTLVADPFGNHDEALLTKLFPDRMHPFKRHYVVDLGRRPETFVSAHHRRNARKAFATVAVDCCESPPAWIDDWTRLYENLIGRHGIQGIARFSSMSFAGQLRTPGLVMYRASIGSRTVGMLLWYVVGDIGYYHLGAYSPEGYAAKASFALFTFALQEFRRRGLRALGLGAGPGVADDSTGGLSRFKRGWATGEQTAYLCGRVLHAERYRELVGRTSPPTEDYFPAYRRGESGSRAHLCSPLTPDPGRADLGPVDLAPVDAAPVDRGPAAPGPGRRDR
ncbi:MAG: GNAT family N-acetyltransferase [Planctomycetota bacterium]